MGKIENKTYKNVFVTPTDKVVTLQVFMKGKTLCGELFRAQAEHPEVKDIAIFCTELDQREFNILINKIKSITDKPTYISFASDKNYNQYAEEYKYLYRHFPDNIYIRNVVVRMDEEKDNLIKPSTPNINSHIKKKSIN